MTKTNAPDGSEVFVVLTTAYGNSDFPVGSTEARPCAPRRAELAESVEQAAEICNRYIAEFDLGGGNWVGDAGLVYRAGDWRELVRPQPVAQIAYNGRIIELGEV